MGLRAMCDIIGSHTRSGSRVAINRFASRPVGRAEKAMGDYGYMTIGAIQIHPDPSRSIQQAMNVARRPMDFVNAHRSLVPTIPELSSAITRFPVGLGVVARSFDCWP
jgi:hypothetical protein